MVSRVDISARLVSILRVPPPLTGSTHPVRAHHDAGNDEAWLHTRSQLVIENCRGAVAGILSAHVPGGNISYLLRRANEMGCAVFNRDARDVATLQRVPRGFSELDVQFQLANLC